MIYVDKYFKKISGKYLYKYTNQYWICYGKVRYDEELGHVMEINKTEWIDNNFLEESVYQGHSFQLTLEHFLGDVFVIKNLERAN